MMDSLVGLDEVVVPKEIDLVNDMDQDLRVPQPKLDLLDFGRSTGTSMEIFVQGVGVGLTHTKNLIIKKLKMRKGKPENWKRKARTLKKTLFAPIMTYRTIIKTVSS